MIEYLMQKSQELYEQELFGEWGYKETVITV